MSSAWVLPALPARAYIAASIGEEALVPPTSFHPPLPLEVSYTATPVAGSASAATSLSVRLGAAGQPGRGLPGRLRLEGGAARPGPLGQGGAPHTLAPAARVRGRAQ